MWPCGSTTHCTRTTPLQIDIRTHLRPCSPQRQHTVPSSCRLIQLQTFVARCTLENTVYSSIIQQELSTRSKLSKLVQTETPLNRQNPDQLRTLLLVVVDIRNDRYVQALILVSRVESDC